MMAPTWHQLSPAMPEALLVLALLALLALQGLAPAFAAEPVPLDAKGATRKSGQRSGQTAQANGLAAGTPQARPLRALAPSAQKAVEERVAIEDEPTHELSPDELEVARAVHVGVMACELGASVTVQPARKQGFFLVGTSKGLRFRMHPTISRTGAVRLEDPKRGAMWLQLENKSMLMSQRLGRRLADECQSPAQREVAQAMKKSPPPSLLDAAPQAAPAADAQ
jgi:hypothetical protein